MSATRCEWFALCTNDAAGLVRHGVLGNVPTCARCAARFDLDFVERFETPDHPRVSVVPMSDVIDDARACGSPFFDDATMRAFRSRLAATATRIERGVDTLFVFVTSERDTLSGAARRYTVRVRRSGERSSVNCGNDCDFAAFGSAKAASSGARRVVQRLVDSTVTS